MTCQRILNKLSAYIDAELPVTTMRTIRRHLEECPGCRKEYNDLMNMQDWMLRSAPASTGSDEFVAAVMDRIHHAPQPFRRRPFRSAWLPAAAYSLVFAAFLLLGIHILPQPADSIASQEQPSWVDLLEQDNTLHLSSIQNSEVSAIWSKVNEISE